MPNVSFTAPLDYTAESDAINRRRKLAEALQQQSFQPIDPGSVNGLPNPISWTQGLAKMLQAHLGASGQRQADTEQRDLSTRYAADTSADTQSLIKALQGRQAQTINPDPQEARQSADYGTPQVSPVNLPAQTPTQSLQEALPQMRTPMGQQMASSYLMEQLKPKELFDKVSPKDYTPESIAAYQTTRNPAVLVPVRAAHFADQGNQITPVDPITGKPQGSPIAKGMSPDASANLAFRKFEFENLNANQRAQLGVELKRLGLSEQQLHEGRVQIVQDADGGVHIVNKITGVGSQATDASGQPLHINKPMTEVQGKANIFGTRAEEADKVLKSLEDKINVSGLATKRGIENTPIIGGPMGALANTALSANQQRVEQAQRDFVNAVLRVESGAAISESEFRNAQKQYFPQPGDMPQVIEQKRRNRATEIAGLKAMAGNRSSVVTNPGANQPFAGQPNVLSWNDLGR